MQLRKINKIILSMLETILQNFTLALCHYLLISFDTTKIQRMFELCKNFMLKDINKM